MLLKTVAFAATAAAFVLIPEISEADEGIFKALPIDVDGFQVPAEAFSQSFNVPCKQCKGKDSQLKFDFTVDDGTRLLLNGFELYPTTDPWHNDLVATVVGGNGKEKKQRLGYSLAVDPQAVDVDQQMSLIDIELRVIEVGGRFVDGVPAVKVHLIAAPNGEILIANTETKEVKETECATMWCRAKELFGQMTKGFKGHMGCGKHKNKGHHGHHGQHGDKHHGDKHHGDKHHGDKHHGDKDMPKDTDVFEGHRQHGERPKHEGGERHHRWGKLLVNIAEHVFLPVLIGIVAGVTAAYVMMFVCRMFVYLIRRSNGAPRQGYWAVCRKTTPREEPAADEEKAGLMTETEHQDAPPVYEDDAAKN